MSRIKNTMQVIEKSIGEIDTRYDISIQNIEDIQKNSNSIYDLVYNGFRLGYIQGKKVAMVEKSKVVQ